MRTLEEIEDMEITEGKTHDGESPCVLSAAELRHLLAIAKTAEEVTCLNYDKCDVKQKVKEARKAGMFGGRGGRSNG